MFLVDADRDTACLRQGDILKNILCPRISTDEVRFLGIISPSGDVATISGERTIERDEPLWKCQMLARVGVVAVISQCCDIAPYHGKITQPAIALARLTPLPAGPAKDPAKLASLRANKFPLNPADPGYINYFHIPECAELGGKEWVIDYNQIISIPKTEFPTILERKVLQMTDDARIRFKIKLAASFGRITAEEEQTGHPWLGDPTPVQGGST